MAANSYTLDFNGFRLEQHWGGLPAASGVYCIHACTYDSDENTVSIKRLLYVGESGNMRKRVPEEPANRRDKWVAQLAKGEVLCASYAKVSSADRERVEAATIYRHKPPCNVEYTNSFPWDKTTVVARGKQGKLAHQFTVDRDD